MDHGVFKEQQPLVAKLLTAVVKLIVNNYSLQLCRPNLEH